MALFQAPLDGNYQGMGKGVSHWGGNNYPVLQET